MRQGWILVATILLLPGIAAAQDHSGTQEVALDDGRSALVPTEAIRLEDGEMIPLFTSSGERAELWFFPGLEADDPKHQSGLITVGDERVEVVCAPLAVDGAKGTACEVPNDVESWTEAEEVSLAFGGTSRILGKEAISQWATWRAEASKQSGSGMVGVAGLGLGPHCNAYFAAVNRLCSDPAILKNQSAADTCVAWMDAMRQMKNAIPPNTPPETNAAMEDGCRAGLDAIKQVEQVWRQP